MSKTEKKEKNLGIDLGTTNSAARARPRNLKKQPKTARRLLMLNMRTLKTENNTVNGASLG